MSCQSRSMYCGSRPISLPADGDTAYLCAALADARDAGIGLDRDHHVALVEAADWDSAADRLAPG